MKRGLLFLTVVLATLVPMTASDAFVSDEVLVKFRNLPDDNFLTRNEMKSLRHIAFIGVDILVVPQGQTVLDYVAQLSQMPEVEFAEPNWILTIGTRPDDPKFTSNAQWEMNNTTTPAASIQAVSGWKQRSSAKNVIVAVIDTGIRATHEDLAENMSTNPGESGGGKETNGVDDDGDGIVDDVHGATFLGGGATISGASDDDYRHGTQMAGKIGAVPNCVGVVGVAWEVKLMSLKAMDNAGIGNAGDTALAIGYAITNGASVINLSSGWPTISSGALQEAIRKAGNAGIPIVCIAQNAGANIDGTTPNYPASYYSLDNLVPVAATDSSDSIWSNSNYGLLRVMLGAPGVNVWSTTRTGASDTSSYLIASGTSLSAPLVAGTLALLKAQYPAESYIQHINRVLWSVDKVPSLSGKCQTGGRLNLASALSSVSTAPFNDSFANRATIVIPDTGSAFVLGNNVTATKESGEPNHAGLNGGASVWWKWLCPSTGSYAISMNGSTFGTAIGVYIGSAVNSLTLIASAAASDDNSSAFVNFSASAGTTYQIAVDSIGTKTGTIQMSLSAGSITHTDLKFTASTATRIRSTSSFTCQVTGGATWGVTFERTSDFVTWSSVGSGITLSGGVGTFTDSGATLGSHYFYRATGFMGHEKSQNVVGYTDVTFTPPYTYTSVPLQPSNPSITSLFPTPANGTTIQVYDGGTQTTWRISTYSSSTGWSDPGIVLNLGAGFIYLGSSSTDFSWTGEVGRGDIENQVSSPWVLLGSKFPKQAPICSGLGFAPLDGDSIWRYVSGSEVQYQYINGVWNPSEPIINVAEGFWINRNINWKQNLKFWP